MGPDGEDALYAFLRTRLEGWQASAERLQDPGRYRQYPGQDEINDGLTLIKSLLAGEESYKFIERFNARKDDLLDFSDSYHDLEHFYDTRSRPGRSSARRIRRFHAQPARTWSRMPRRHRPSGVCRRSCQPRVRTASSRKPRA